MFWFRPRTAVAVEPRRTTVIVNGLKRRLDLREGIQSSMASGAYEPHQTEWVRSILRPGGRFVDVGASFGHYTSLASGIVGAEGRVFAFEPSPVAHASLLEMVADNGITNIELCQAAVGDREGEVEILLPPDDQLHSPSIFSCEDGFTPHRVPLVRLDAHAPLADGVPIDLIKIDVEGFEPNVIEGMRLLIARGMVRNISCEFNSGWLRRNAGMTPARLIKTIRGLGYAVVASTEKVVGMERDGETPFELQDVWFTYDPARAAETGDA